MSDAQEPQIGRVVCVSGSQVVALIAPDHVAPPLRKGHLVKLPLPEATVFGLVSGLSIPAPAVASASEVRLAELELIGEAGCGEDHRPAGFRRGVSMLPALGEPVLRAEAEDLACVYAPAAGATLRIGATRLDAAQPARVSPDALLGDHLAILGAAGCGKSCALGLILQRLLERRPETRVLLLDPRNEHAHAFADSAEVLGPDSLQLPYWLLDAGELAAALFGAHPHDPAGEEVSALLAELLPIARRLSQRERAGGPASPTIRPCPTA